MKKTFVFDIDGTLYTNNWDIHPKSIAAIKKLVNDGHQFILASGRPIESLKKISKEMLPVDPIYLIGSNGMTVWDYKSKQVVKTSTVPQDCIKEILKIPDAINSKLIIQRPGKTLTYNFSDKNHALIKKLNMGGSTPVSLKEMGKIDNAALFTLFEWRDDGLWSKHESWFNKLANKYNLQILKMVVHDFIDILPQGASKADALKWIESQGFINKNNSYVFGDGINDIEMLEWANYSYAMANSLDITKAAAKEVIGFNDDPVIGQKVIEILENK